MRQVVHCSNSSVQLQSNRTCAGIFRLGDIWRDHSGNVAVTFSLISVILFLFVGGAVDFGRWIQARSKTIAAMDAAVLAGARVLQLDGSDLSGAVDAAERFYASNTAHRVPLESDTISFKVVDDGLAFTATGNAFIRTPFLSLAQIDRLPLLDRSGAEYSKAVLAVGGNAEHSIEISMMLDITGSMSGSKLEDMKTAAKDLIDIVVWEDQSEYTSRVALVPFSAAVNPGTLGATVASNPANPVSLNFSDGNSRSFRRSSCVSERLGASRYTDAAPTGPNRLPRVYSSDGLCEPGSNATVIPLTSDKDALKSGIDSFSARGATAGHLGTGWAWYLLSPNWGSVLPASSQPAEYGAESVHKIAILMTDGDFNMQYCNTSSTAGVSAPDRNSNGFSSTKLSCTATNGSSTSQARALCNGMKSAGIVVYTVGFDISPGSNADTTMRQCATSNEHTYSASSGEQLKQAFRDIALKISSLYLSR